MNDTRYRAAVVAFKRQLIETTLRAHAGNRTHAARALGLPRTYLVRLIRHLAVSTPLSRRAGQQNEFDAGSTTANGIEARASCEESSA